MDKKYIKKHKVLLTRFDKEEWQTICNKHLTTFSNTYEKEQPKLESETDVQYQERIDIHLKLKIRGLVLRKREFFEEFLLNNKKAVEQIITKGLAEPNLFDALPVEDLPDDDD